MIILSRVTSIKYNVLWKEKIDDSNVILVLRWIAWVYVAAQTGVTAVNFQACYRKTVASFVGGCLKNKQTNKPPKPLIPLNDPCFLKLY